MQTEHEVTDASVQELAQRMPSSLTSLDLDLKRSEVIDAAVKEHAQRLPSLLTSLDHGVHHRADGFHANDTKSHGIMSLFDTEDLLTVMSLPIILPAHSDELSL